MAHQKNVRAGAGSHHEQLPALERAADERFTYEYFNESQDGARVVNTTSRTTKEVVAGSRRPD